VADRPLWVVAMRATIKNTFL